MSPMNSVAALDEEEAQQAFLERFGNARPQISGEAISDAFTRGLDAITLPAHVETLEQEMERLLGIVSDEEE